MHLVKLKQFDAYPRKIDPSRDYSSPASILSTRGGARIRGHLQTWPVEKGPARRRARVSPTRTPNG